MSLQKHTKRETVFVFFCEIVKFLLNRNLKRPRHLVP